MSRMKSAFCDHCFCKENICCKCGRNENEILVSSYIDSYPQWNDGDGTIFPEVKKLSMREINSRLLSDEDLSLAVGYKTPDSQAIDDYERSVAIAQDLRTSQWWMEKIDQLLKKSDVCLDLEHAQCDICSSIRRKPCIYNKWQDLKEMERKQEN